MSRAEDVLAGCAWPEPRTGEMLRGLAAAAGLTAGAAPASSDGESSLATVALIHGLRVEPMTITARGGWEAVRRALPAVLELPGAPGRLAVVRGRARGRVEVLAPDGRRRTIPAAALEDGLWAPIDRRWGASGAIAALAGGRVRAGVAAARVLATPTLGGRPLGEAWLVRSATVRVRDELRAARVGRRAAVVAAAYFVQFALLSAIWSDVGGRALGGTGAGRWVTLACLLGAWVAAQVGASWQLGRLALDVGARLRSALMRGALHLDRDRIRAAGIGQLLGRALEAAVLDVLALGGGVELVAAAFELALGAVVLGLGAAPIASLVGLAATLLVLAFAARAQARRLRRWSQRRRAMTHELVERMVGHRTVLVQDRAEQRAAADDATLASYGREVRALDRAEVVLSVVIPRLWFVLGVAVLGATLLRSMPTPAPIALTVGGVWLIHGALRRLGAALPTLAAARDAWQQIAPLLGGTGGEDEDEAAGVAPTAGGVCAASSPAIADGDAAALPLLAAEGLGYQYRGRATPALAGVDLTIGAGDRLLIEGPSGGGKSTLAALLTGLRRPTAGRLCLHGVDQQVVGLARWRRSVAGAPQFHDNHVFSADLLFNVLMGRRWPPRLEDVEEAERVCSELGLGPLLARMPAGLQQQVGETGWRLSHGERSRLFVARALLQPVEARVLDESFAALDPETLEAVLEAVLRRPEALLVIAHP